MSTKVSTSLIYYIHALSSLHMGTGAAIGAIDLPHSREASTGLPNAPGSGIKGVLRDVLRNCEQHTRLFGAEPEDRTNRDQGALLFSDALLLCLPVPSYSGGFAWVSSPTALRRYARECLACGRSQLPEIPTVTDGRAACAGNPLPVAGKLYLHDVELEIDNEGSSGAAVQIARDIATALYGNGDKQAIEFFGERFAIVDDKVLGYLASVAMDIRTRIAISDDTKTVRKGGLWIEENLPSETVLWGSIAADTICYDGNKTLEAGNALKAFTKACGARRRLQLGGNATVGRGIVQFVLHEVTHAQTETEDVQSGVRRPDRTEKSG